MNVKYKDATPIIIFAVIAIIGLGSAKEAFSLPRKDSGIRILSPQEAGKRAVNYISKYILRGGSKASLIKARERNGVYEIRLNIGGLQYNSYITKDGKFLFPRGIDLTLKPGKEPPQKISKRDVPDVKLFVMSYCPFGLQMEKAFLPVYKLLKNKAHIGVYFVSYSMHGKKEIDEDVRQYCIQKEEQDKYYNYLNCFVRENNFRKCLSAAGIDKHKLSRCISGAEQKYNITKDYKDKSTYLSGRFPRVGLQAELNKKYKVRGSPTVVINDEVVRIYPRSPEKFKEVVCSAFKSPPEECSVKLSNKVSSAGSCGPE